MPVHVECPVCGEKREFPPDAPIGARRICRKCGALLEVRAAQPLKVVKIPLRAEDFGI